MTAQLTAQELRIGNYVVGASRGGFHQVDIGILDYINKHKSGYGRIPITEEWLLKFGFKFHGYNSQDMAVHRRCDNVWIVKNIVTKKYYLDEYDLEIKYIHQLQNLYFAITGEELKLNKW